MSFTDVGLGALIAIGILAIIAIIFGLILLLPALLVMIAWNLVASIFSAITISYLQAIGVTIGLWLATSILGSIFTVKQKAVE